MRSSFSFRKREAHAKRKLKMNSKYRLRDHMNEEEVMALLFDFNKREYVLPDAEAQMRLLRVLKESDKKKQARYETSRN
jgi:hypothetical protein